MRCLIPLLLLFLPVAAEAQHGGLAEFNQVTSRWYALSKTPVLNEKVKVSIAPDDSLVLFTVEMRDGTPEIMKLDPEQGGPAKIALEDISPVWKDFRAGDQGTVYLQTPDGVWMRRDGERWLSMEPPPLPHAMEKPPENGKTGWRSPDGNWEVAIRDGTVCLKNLRDSFEKELGRAEAAGVFRGEPLWAPDSSRFLLWQVHEAPKHEVHYVESSPKDQVQPKSFSIDYPKPGDEIDTRVPWVFYTSGEEPMAADPALIADAFELRNPEWRRDSQRLTFEFIARGFSSHQVIEMNTAACTQRVLVREDSADFVYVYGNSFRRDLDDGKEILWMSERDGWKHLYLLDGETGQVKRQLTQGQWIVREVVEVDEARREVLLKVSGCYAGQDPYLIHYARVGIDSGKLTLLTQANGTHTDFQHAPGGKYYSCRWSRVDQAPVTELHRWEDGALVTVLGKADDSKLRATGYPIAEPFMAKDREGKFDIHGVIIRPPEFDPAKKYPVVENIYAGPQDSYVPVAWSRWLGAKSDLAAFGFIVVQIDGRGTANRCREFHHFCYKNLKDAGLPDRIAWMKAAAAEKCPQMDLSRVGIYGGSAGGQNALGALLFHPEFYQAAAADCGCHDNRMDKIWWNEQWMGWPVGPEYADNSNVTHAKNLQGALLLTVGEVDTNVDPSSTYQVIDALIAADKDFEFLPMTGRNHGAGEDRYAQRRRVEFFQRHLGGPR